MTSETNETNSPVAPLSEPGEPSIEAGQSTEAVAALSEIAATASDASGMRKRILTAAAIIAVGQLLSSILGFVRIETLNVLFYGVASGAFVFALRPVQQINDLIVGESVSGALIPTFVDYSAPEKREELRRVYSTVLNLILLVMGAAIIGLFFLAPILIPFEAKDLPAEGQTLTVLLVRIIAFSLIGLTLYFVSKALLYALRDVALPSIATGIYHVGIIVCGIVALMLAANQLGLPLSAILSHATGATGDLVHRVQMLGAPGLAVGTAIGALCEFLIVIPGLRRAGITWRPTLSLRHPAVRQILKLYGPIAISLIVSVLFQNLDLSLQGRTPGGVGQNVTALQSGTVLTQFPVGLVAAALSFAVLPLLAAAATRDDLADFKRTLRIGFRLGLLLMVPAAVGLYVLSGPIAALLFQHGQCDHACTVRNVLAIQNYSYQLPFLALDQLLVAAFYARKNTVTPMIVGIVSIIFYLVVALPFGTVSFVPFGITIGMPAIAFGNAALNSGHAIILFVLLTLAIGNLGMGDLLNGVARILIAAAAMAATCWAGMQLLPLWRPALFSLDHTSGQGLTFLVAGILGSVVYFAVVTLLRVEEVRMIGGIARSRLGRSR